MKKIHFSVFALILLASCSQSEPFEADGADKEIRAVSSIEGNVDTRAVISGTDAVLSDLTFLRIDDVNPSLGTYNFSSATSITGSSRAAGGVISFGTEQTYDKTADKTTYMRGFTTVGIKSGGAAGTTTWTVDGATDILLTDVWNAGRYSLPGSNQMKFCHQLSRIEVICQGEPNVAASVVQAAWGKVQSIKLSSANPELLYTHSTNAVTASGVAKDFPLLNGAEYDASKALTAFDIPAYGNTTVHAAAMVCPQTATVKLKITTGNQAEMEVTTTLAALDRAKIHKITLTFKSDAKTIECKSSTIEEWTAGNTGTSDVVKP